MIDTNMIGLPRILDVQQGGVSLNALNLRNLVRGASLRILKKKTIIIFSAVILSFCLLSVVSKVVSIFVSDDFPDEDNVVITGN